MLALGGAATAVAGGDVFVGAGGDLTVDVSQHAMLTADSAMVDLTHAPWAQQRLLYWEPGGGFELEHVFPLDLSLSSLKADSCTHVLLPGTL